MDRIDLNLLASLDVLIEEANVTRAATRLGISQPAMSAQLARLRETFGDPLLVPSNTGRGMVPTPRALAVRDPLHIALHDLQAIVRKPPDFDPMTGTRTFTIMASDFALIVLGVPFIELMRSIAGRGVRLDIRPLPSGGTTDTMLEMGEIDVMIGVSQRLPAMLRSRKLFDERFVVIRRKNHPSGAGSLDLATYCTLDHVIVSPIDGSLYGGLDERLEALGHRRNVALSVPQFMIVPIVVERTDLVAALPERFARRLVDRVDMLELPFEAPGFGLFAAWHQRSHSDPSHIWLRSELSKLATRLASFG